MRKILSLAIAALFSATMFATTYTVVGVSAICGSDWGYTDATNDMALVSGTTYQLVKTNLELGAGNYNYKVCEDHDWAVEHPSGYGNDKTVTIAESGIYKITFTFDTSDPDNPSAVAEKTGEAVVVPNMTVKGGWDGWTIHAMTKAGNNETASVTINITSTATFEFGLEKAGSWQANGETVTRAANSTVVNGSGSNMKLVVDAMGEYTFTWTYATNTLVVTFPTEDPDARPTVQMKGNWDSWAADVDYEWALNKETASVSKALTAGDYPFKMIIGGQWRSKDWNITRDYNTVASITENPSENIVLKADVDGTYVFTWTHASNTLTVTFPTPTGINDIENGEMAAKELRNGQLFIIKGEKTYNVLGQEVR